MVKLHRCMKKVVTPPLPKNVVMVKLRHCTKVVVVKLRHCKTIGNGQTPPLHQKVAQVQIRHCAKSVYSQTPPLQKVVKVKLHHYISKTKSQTLPLHEISGLNQNLPLHLPEEKKSGVGWHDSSFLFITLKPRVEGYKRL